MTKTTLVYCYYKSFIVEG